MNFLAHAYLSFNNPPILAGNIFSDFVKGKNQYDYDGMIQKGIRLHRSIDKFTDAHPATKEMKKVFVPHYRLYAGAFADVVYDFFLANDRSVFNSNEDLAHFSKETYLLLDPYMPVMPAIFGKMFPYMKAQDWLYHYSTHEGIQRSFAGMARRAKYITETDTAFKLFTDNLYLMKPCYDDFFSAIKIHSKNTLQSLLTED